MQVMHNIERYQCNPDTAEPYLLKLSVLPTINNISIGENPYYNINQSYNQPNHDI